MKNFWYFIVYFFVLCFSSIGWSAFSSIDCARALSLFRETRMFEEAFYEREDVAAAPIQELISQKDWVISRHVLEDYEGSRAISAQQVSEILKSGKLHYFSQIDERHTPRYVWFGRDLSGMLFRLIIGVSDKLYVISAAQANQQNPSTYYY